MALTLHYPMTHSQIRASSLYGTKQEHKPLAPPGRPSPCHQSRDRPDHLALHAVQHDPPATKLDATLTLSRNLADFGAKHVGLPAEPFRRGQLLRRGRPVSPAVWFTAMMLAETCLVPFAASWTLRAISGFTRHVETANVSRRSVMTRRR